jgi:hypothetical protein
MDSFVRFGVSLPLQSQKPIQVTIAGGKKIIVGGHHRREALLKIKEDHPDVFGVISSQNMQITDVTEDTATLSKAEKVDYVVALNAKSGAAQNTRSIFLKNDPLANRFVKVMKHSMEANGCTIPKKFVENLITGLVHNCRNNLTDTDVGYWTAYTNNKKMATATIVGTYPQHVIEKSVTNFNKTSKNLCSLIGHFNDILDLDQNTATKNKLYYILYELACQKNFMDEIKNQAKFKKFSKGVVTCFTKLVKGTQTEFDLCSAIMYNDEKPVKMFTARLMKNLN